MMISIVEINIIWGYGGLVLFFIKSTEPLYFWSGTKVLAMKEKFWIVISYSKSDP